MNTIINDEVSRKTRSDASWSRLSAEQQGVLEGWLFEDGLSYDEVLTRAQKELGFTGSVWGLKRFYKKRAHSRLLQELVASAAEATKVGKAVPDVRVLEEACLKVLTQRLFNRVQNEEVADVAVLGKLVAQAEANERKRERLEVQRAAQAVRRARLNLDQERWQYDVVEESKKVLVAWRALERKQNPAKADIYLERKRLNVIRQRLFGKMHKDLLFPENAREERAQKRREEKERLQRAEEHKRAMSAPSASSALNMDKCG